MIVLFSMVRCSPNEIATVYDLTLGLIVMHAAESPFHIEMRLVCFM